jgi:hypothetical protein
MPRSAKFAAMLALLALCLAGPLLPGAAPGLCSAAGGDYPGYEEVTVTYQANGANADDFTLSKNLYLPSQQFSAGTDRKCRLSGVSVLLQGFEDGEELKLAVFSPDSEGGPPSENLTRWYYFAGEGGEERMYHNFTLSNAPEIPGGDRLYLVINLTEDSFEWRMVDDGSRDYTSYMFVPSSEPDPWNRVSSVWGSMEFVMALTFLLGPEVSATGLDGAVLLLAASASGLGLAGLGIWGWRRRGRGGAPGEKGAKGPKGPKLPEAAEPDEPPDGGEGEEGQKGDEDGGEAAARARYLRDATSTHAYLAIHREQGTVFSDRKYLLGHGLKEDLLSGLVTALLSLVEELKGQMGKQSGSDGVKQFRYDEFTLTVYPGKEMWLCTVSDGPHGELMDRRCRRALDRYENLHLVDLQYHTGDMKPYRDFPAFVAREVGGELNEESRVLPGELEGSGLPEGARAVLRDLAESGERFFPAKLPSTLSRELEIPRERAADLAVRAWEAGAVRPAEEAAGGAPGGEGKSEEGGEQVGE